MLPERWKRLKVREAGLSKGGAVLPQFSLCARTEGEIAALAPLKEIMASLVQQGARFETARVLLDNVTTEAVDGVDLLNELRDWDKVRQRSVIKSEYLEELKSFQFDTESRRVRFSAVTEVYKTDILHIELELSGRSKGRIGAETKFDGGATKAMLSDASEGSLKVRVKKKLPAPTVVGVVGYTYDVNLDDGTFQVDPIVTSGAGSGGFKN